MMEITKELKDISWQVDEPEYRQDPALSYSTLSTYEREGFNGLSHLFDKKESTSLTFGSCVDAILTGGMETFYDNFSVLDMRITDSGKDICKQLVSMKLPYTSFYDIPINVVSGAAKEVGFWKGDKWDTKRYTEVLKTGNIGECYNAMVNEGKTVIDTQTYESVMACVQALRESNSTSGYFAQNDEMSPVRRYFQLKFKAKFNGVTYRCMADEIVVDYEDKVIYPIDIKTSTPPEWDFKDHFLTWNYMIQARLYWRIIKANIMADPYFKDFTLKDYKFIVVSRYTLTPLVWEFPLTQTMGTLVDKNGKEYRDPFEIGKELRGYLDLMPKVPNNIDVDGENVIDCLELKPNA